MQKFREVLIGLTSVTWGYFHKLVQWLEEWAKQMANGCSGTLL